MAGKRMFSNKITNADAFLDMPLSSQCLYFHLNMNADDDGFVGNPKTVMRMIGASEDDMKLLLMKSFLLSFDSGVIVIKHWRMHNTLSAGRYKETSYIEEKSQLLLKENGSYSFTEGIEIDDKKMIETSKRQCRRTKDEQKTNTDKNSIDKNSIEQDKNSIGKNKYYESDILNNAFSEYVSMRKSIKKPLTENAIKRAKSKLENLSNGDDYLAVLIIQQSVDNCWLGLFPYKGAYKKEIIVSEVKEEAPIDYGWED